MSLAFRFDASSDGLEKLFAGQQAKIMGAAQQALALCGQRVEDQGRASIASAGFDARWQDGLKVVLYPSKEGGTVSVSHEIPYAVVFEQGAVIDGQPLLWLPLPSCPATIGGRHPTPSAYMQSIGPLRYVAGHNHPLLVGVTATPPKAPPALGVRRLSGPRREKTSALRSGAQNGGYDVPMFFGVPSVTITKKFDVLGVVERAYADLAQSFSANLKEG